MYDKRKFTKEEVEKAVIESISYAELARKLGYSSESGHYKADVQKWIEKYHCDTSHFKGQGWNKGNFNLDKLKEKKAFKGGELLKFLLDGLKKPRKCECCGNTEWNGKPIPLQVHHIDGNHYNNSLDNLQLLCLNCHAQTDNFCGKGGVGKVRIFNEKVIEIAKDSYSISEIIRKLGICDTQSHRQKIKEIIEYNNISLLKKEKINKEKNHKLKAEEESKRKEYFLSGKIDFTKYGWVTQASKDLGLSHTQIRRWVNKNLPKLNIYRRQCPGGETGKTQ